MSTLRSVLWAAVLLVAAPAAAQDLGLDLSDGPDLRPTLAVLGIAIPTTAAPSDRARAEKLTGALVGASRKTNWFAKVLEPADCAQVLGESAGPAQACEEADCLADLARQLGVDRVLTAQVDFPADGPNLKLHALDAGKGTPEVVAVLSQGKPASFERSVALAFKPLLQTLQTHLGTVKIVANEPTATIEVLGRTLGTGTVEKAVSAGTLKVRVTAPDFQPFEGELVVEPKGTAELQAKLERKLVVAANPVVDAPPIEVKAAPGKPFYERGGVYLAAAGVIAAAVGIAFGAMAKDVEGRAKDANNDGVLDVTRAQTFQAQTNATLANVLVSTGAAMAAGGVLWLVLEPVLSSPPGKDKEPGGPKTEPTTVGLLIKVGGEF